MRSELTFTPQPALASAPSIRGPIMPDDWPNRAFSQYHSAGGVNWHLQRNGQGPVMLLLHGTAASTHSWRDLLPELSKDFDVIAVDLPGHGFSSRRADQDMTLNALAEATSALLDLLDARPAVVVGHSAGAAIALRMALDKRIAPGLIIGLNAALLPFGGALRFVFAPMAQLFANTRLMPKMVARRATDSQAVRRILSGTGSHIDEAGVAQYQRLLQSEAHVAAVLAMMASWDLNPLLADIASLEPALALIVGLQDKAVSPREADSVARAVANTRIERLSDCGHLAHEEQPGRVAALIRDLALDRPGTADV